MLFLMLRGNYVRTYHWVALVELTILGLWIAPLVTVSRDLESHLRGEKFASTVATLVFFGLNMYVFFPSLTLSHLIIRSKS